MNRKVLSGLLAVLIVLAMIVPKYAEASGFKSIDTGIKTQVTAVGQYSNWDGVPSVSQFKDEKGQPAFAYKAGKKIKVVKTKDGKVKKKMNLKMKGSIFGAVTCDGSGNVYAVTGKKNSGDDTKAKTVFITKYNKNGKLIKSIGDNGRSSLADYYDQSYNTKEPFSGGTCDVAINGNYMAVDYGRKMYSGHQSNSVWMINTKTMKTVRPNSDEYYGYLNYESHSFGQRTVAYEGGFAFMSEGDCYDRAFTFSTADIKKGKASEQAVFDFWVKKGTFDAYDMGTLNNNFAHIGDINDLGNGNISFVASSAKAMNSKAQKQKEQIFIQIFDPSKDLTKKSAYVTAGNRTGTAGNNGDKKKTNYGVKWLTGYNSGTVENPQAVTDGKGNTIILYERYGNNYSYKGVYAMKVNSKGKIIKKAKCISKKAKLNSCETPIYSGGNVYWCSNKHGDNKFKLYVHKCKI